MGISRRLRNIALSQINAIKDRLDRIDAEAEAEAIARRAERDARKELDDVTDIRPPLRTPEEIVSGTQRRPAAEPPTRPAAPQATSPTATGPLAVHYRVLGVPDGSDLATVDASYAALASRCSPARFHEGSEEQKAAEEILKRVDAAYHALRDALDPTAGRFDKLEL